MNKCLKCEHGGILNLNTLECYLLNNNLLNHSIAKDFCNSINSSLMKTNDINELNTVIGLFDEIFWVIASSYNIRK